MQEAGLADPALLVDHDAVHHGDLPGRAAEAECRNPGPDREPVAERDDGTAERLDRGGHETGAGWAAGQLWVSPAASRHQRQKAS
jgi:hypothetical protein